MKKYLKIAALAFSLTLLIASCSLIKEVSNTLTNMSRLKFKLAFVNDFSLGGIKLEGKNQLNDFSISDGLKITQMFTSKRMPARFILNVEAQNPNDGTGGSPKTSATLTSFDWKLYIDGKETVAGNIANPISVPGTGQSTYIPLAIELDLYKFFKDKGYDDLVKLALAIGGVNGSSARLSLDAKPTVNTSYGPITYPGRLTIVDKEWKQ